MNAATLNVALVHDYLIARGGAERVVGELSRIFPDAPVYAAAFDPGNLPPVLDSSRVRASHLQRAPGIRRHYRAYLPFYPSAFRQFDLDEYDMVLASSSAFAHTVRTAKPLAVYLYTPPRFLWQTARYLENEPRGISLTTRAARPMLDRLRKSDLEAAKRVTQFVTCSTAAASRIADVYGRTAHVVPPPVDVDRFAIGEQDDFALVVARLQPYKDIHLAIKACSALRIPLIVVGEGPARAALERDAGPMTTFLGHVSDAEVARLMGSARVLIVSGEEDFGLTPLEANASGCPVVALGRGGALDTVIQGKTGLLFDQPVALSLAAALEASVSRSWDRDVLRRHAETFDTKAFRRGILDACATVADSS
jgi:glycosyltransferase involved in cell wall biosynthesis